MRALLLLPVLALAACIEAPGVGRAANPGQATEAAAPWGSATSNEELGRKVGLLQEYLDGRLQPAEVQARVEKEFGKMSAPEREKALAAMKELLDERVMPGGWKPGTPMPEGPARDMILARLYFSERRFIESATLLSSILDRDSIHPQARDLLARCFFFLGNRDRTIVELEYILTNPIQSKDMNEVADALFLLGAAVSETPGMSRENMLKGKGAWENFLKLVPDSPQKPQILEGLKDIEAGLQGEGRLAQPLVPDREGAVPQDSPRNVMGGSKSFNGTEPAPMGPGTAAPEAPRVNRVAQLKADAPPFDKAVAAGLDALEARDLATSEARLKEALALNQSAAEPLVGLGRVYVQSGRIPEALRTFGEAIKYHPDYMPAWHYNGMAHMMSQSPKEAVESWQHILDKDPDYARTYSLDKRIAVARRMAGGG